MSNHYFARQKSYEALRSKYAQLQPGRAVDVEVTIGKDHFWWPGQVKKHTENGRFVVEVEYKDMADERRFQTMTVDLHQLRLAKENESE